MRFYVHNLIVLLVCLTLHPPNSPHTRPLPLVTQRHNFSLLLLLHVQTLEVDSQSDTLLAGTMGRGNWLLTDLTSRLQVHI